MKKILLYLFAILLCVSLNLSLFSCMDDVIIDDVTININNPGDDDASKDPEVDPDKLPEPEEEEETEQPSDDGLEDDDSEDEDENEENNSNNSGGNNNKPNYNDGGINLPFVPAS